MLPDHCAQASSFSQVEEFVEEEAEGLKAKAEEAKEELDKLADLQNLRAEVAFNSALAGKSTCLHKCVATAGKAGRHAEPEAGGCTQFECEEQPCLPGGSARIILQFRHTSLRRRHQPGSGRV